MGNDAVNKVVGPVQKLLLRISVTDRCQLRCSYCMPPGGITLHSRNDILSYEEIVTLVHHLHHVAPLGKLRLTGGEPLVRPDIERLVAMLAVLHIPDMALTTNGQLLAGFAEPLKSAGLNRVNVSLDSLDVQTYRRLSGGGVLSRTLDGIAAALHCGLLPLKTNTVVIRGVNDTEILNIVAFAVERGIEARFLEVMPIGVAAKHCREWFFSGAEVKAVIQTRYRMDALPREPGSTCRSFTLNDHGCAVGRIGLISACSEPFCHDCGRLRLTSEGCLMGCLAVDAGVPVRALLTSGPEGLDQLAAVVGDILACKKVRTGFSQPKVMAAIGG